MSLFIFESGVLKDQHMTYQELTYQAKKLWLKGGWRSLIRKPEQLKFHAQSYNDIQRKLVDPFSEEFGTTQFDNKSDFKQGDKYKALIL